MTKFACQIDSAQHREAEIVADSLNAIRSLVPSEKHELTEDDLTCCICGEEDSIPPARARKGYSSCVSCQSMIESKSKHYGRRSRGYEDE